MSISKVKLDGRVSNADLAKMVVEVHDCIHSFQKDMTHKLEGHQIVLSSQITQVRDKVDGLEGKVDSVDLSVRAAEQRISRVEGIQSAVYGAKTSSDGQVTVPKVKKNILTMPWWQAGPALLALVVAGSGTYKLAVAILEAIHHYLMTAAK